MPFWWARRRKPWYRTWRKRRNTWTKYKRRTKFRRRRRPLARRRRRRRRRRYKVRKKRKTIPIRQWQPDSIVKCKIKGYGTLVAGAEGRQLLCYTNEKKAYIQPKAPGGGGFGSEVFSLQYLYNLFLAHKNIWTKSNDYKDLVRFTGSKFTFYRNPKTDFIIAYQRQPPFLIEKETYLNIHPLNLLLRKKKRILLSTQTNPNGKPKIHIKIGPPKQMISKWFFQEQFADQGLLQIDAAAANFNYSIYSPTSQSNSITFYSLNTEFYKNSDWGLASGSTPYKPWTTAPTLKFYPSTTTQQPTTTIDPTKLNYLNSVNYSTGYFQKAVLQAAKVTNTTTTQHNLPITVARYNPDEDTGDGSMVYVLSIQKNSWYPPSDETLKISGRPLWMLLYGFWSYVQKTHNAPDFMQNHIFVIKSKAIKLITPHTQDTFVPIDPAFLQGKLAWDEFITEHQKQFWYPDATKQQKALNDFVESGPYVPKYSSEREDTWELKFSYSFYFKWGGPYTTNPDVSNPKNQGKYPVPDTVLQTVQVANPLKQAYKNMLRAWDYRRDIITTTALKRMSENNRSDQSFQSDDSEPEKKKSRFTGELPSYQDKTQEVQSCLLSLCEESTCQKEEKDLLQLIHQQQQQQQQLKNNLFKLLIDLKKQQRHLQLQTGMLN
nr:MAG: ORF1 [Torque teno midi virus]